MEARLKAGRLGRAYVAPLSQSLSADTKLHAPLRHLRGSPKNTRYDHTAVTTVCRASRSLEKVYFVVTYHDAVEGDVDFTKSSNFGMFGKSNSWPADAYVGSVRIGLTESGDMSLVECITGGCKLRQSRSLELFERRPLLPPPLSVPSNAGHEQ